MATTTKSTAKTARDLTGEITYLTRALKAPTLRDSVDRLVERAVAESWSHLEFLVACLQREVSARESHGGEGRIRAARFPARKSIEEFDFDHARGLKRELIAHLGTEQFNRIRIGIARPAPGVDIADYVLSDFAKAEAEAVERALSLACEAMEMALEQPFDRVMAAFNRS